MSLKIVDHGAVIAVCKRPDILNQMRDIFEPLQFEIHPAFRHALKITEEEMREY